MLFMSSPKRFIFGLPSTEMTTSQNFINASSLHFTLTWSKRNIFCHVASLFWMIVFRSPPEMMPKCFRSNTIAFTSISLMNRGRSSSRTCSTARNGWDLCHYKSDIFAYCKHASYTHFEEDHACGKKYILNYLWTDWVCMWTCYCTALYAMLNGQENKQPNGNIVSGNQAFWFQCSSQKHGQRTPQLPHMSIAIIIPYKVVNALWSMHACIPID